MVISITEEARQPDYLHKRRRSKSQQASSPFSLCLLFVALFNLAKSDKKIKLNRVTRTRTKITMDYLPDEIVFNIFSRLTISSLVRIKLVCRAWRDLTLHPHLINRHLQRQIENDPCLVMHSDHPIRNQVHFINLSIDSENDKRVKKLCHPDMPDFVIIGSFNGLLCLQGSSPWNYKLYIYNPFTRNLLELPGISTLNSDKSQIFEFGFHPSTKEYKLIRIVYERSLSLLRDVHILTLGNTWRSIGKFPYRIVTCRGQAFVNGRFHWVFLPKDFVRLSYDIFLLVSFDLADEKFREVPRPANPRSFSEGFSHLVALQGCLAVASLANDASVEIWIMKNYNDGESWIKQYSIGHYNFGRDLKENVVVSSRLLVPYSRGGPLRVLCLLKNGEILLHYLHRFLVCYNPESKTFRDLTFPGSLKWFETFVHVGSLNWIDI